MRWCALQVKNCKPFFCNFVNFKSIGKKIPMHTFYPLGKKYAFPPLFSSPFNHFFLPNMIFGHINHFFLPNMIFAHIFGSHRKIYTLVYTFIYLTFIYLDFFLSIQTPIYIQTFIYIDRLSISRPLSIHTTQPQNSSYTYILLY